MSSFEDLAARHQARFRMFATAVAGERALAVATGMPPVSLKQWTRSRSFKAALMSDTTIELQRYYEEHMSNAGDIFRERSAARFGVTSINIADIAQQVMNQTSKQAKFGLADPMKALDPSRPAGAIGLLAQRRLANPEFKVQDPQTGFKWAAESLVHKLVRDYAYQIFIDAQYDSAIQDGKTSITLDHADVNHPLRGQELPLSGDNWLTIRDDVFHVNSKLMVSNEVI